MGILLSKNPLIDDEFDGESGDYNLDAANFQQPFGPEWVLGNHELEYIKSGAKDLDNVPEKVPYFSLSGHLVPGKCVKVYDGDTAHFVVKFQDQWVRRRFRMIGYNSPEVRGGTEEEKERGRIARDYLAERLLDKKVLLYLGDFDKYGRPLCDVYLIEDVNNITKENAFLIHLNKEMIEHGYGTPYKG